MKKLMFALVAGACATVMADEIASANIVGYAQQDETKGNQAMKGTFFQTAGKENLDISDIKPVGTITDGCMWIKWWDTEKKSYSIKYEYVTELYDEKEQSLGYPGWGDPLTWVPVEKTFAPGEGFWLQANADNLKSQTSGEVYQPTTEYYAIPLTKGNQKMLINSFPVALNVQDLTVDVAKVSDGCAWIKWWDTEKKVYSIKYEYVTELYDEKEQSLGYPGWGDPLTWVPVAKTFAVGEGFWVQSNVDDLKIAFKNPFYKAK